MEVKHNGFAMAENTHIPALPELYKTPSGPGAGSSGDAVTSEVSEELHAMGFASYTRLQTSGDSRQVPDRH